MMTPAGQHITVAGHVQFSARSVPFHALFFLRLRFIFTSRRASFPSAGPAVSFSHFRRSESFDARERPPADIRRMNRLTPTEEETR